VLAERVAACGSLRAAAQASFNAAEGAVAKALAALPKETKGARQEYDGSDAKVTESGAPPDRWVQLGAVSVERVVHACKDSIGVFARLAQQEIDRERSGQGVEARPSFFLSIALNPRRPPISLFRLRSYGRWSTRTQLRPGSPTSRSAAC